MNCRNTKIKVISLITVANHNFTNYTDNQANTCGWQEVGYERAVGLVLLLIERGENGASFLSLP